MFVIFGLVLCKEGKDGCLQLRIKRCWGIRTLIL